MAITLLNAEPTHLRSVADLLIEMDRFYGEPDPESVGVKIGNMTSALFGDGPSASLLVAWDDEGSEAVGVAAYSYLWPAVGTTRSVYSKELYVLKSHRHLSVGRSLMTRLFEIARENGCSRVEWTTDRGER